MKKIVPLFSGPVIFVEEGHEYYVEVDGETRKMPSLSSVLRRTGLAPVYKGDIPEAVLAAAAARGTEVHAAIANTIEGAPVTIKPENEYLLENAKKLYAEYEMETVYNEVPFFNPVWDYCATPDLIGKVRGKLAVIDWKSTVKIHRETGAQLAGQALCFRHPEEFDLYVGDLRNGLLHKYESERFLTVTRQGLQLYNDFQDLVNV